MNLLGTQEPLPRLLERAVAAELLARERAEKIYLQWRQSPHESLAALVVESAGLAPEVVAALESAADRVTPEGAPSDARASATLQGTRTLEGTQSLEGTQISKGTPGDGESKTATVNERSRRAETADWTGGFLSGTGVPAGTEALTAAANAAEDPQATVPPLAAETYTPSPQRRFCKLRPHREGGLGAVYVAEDMEVPRQVALKEIRAVIADDASARHQFLFEARVTGALEHPGVVPVYGCGVYQDGRPYYAMRFVEGDDLHEVTAAFHRHRESEPDTAETNLELRQLLGRIIAVAQVLDYAHSRGVLHRDLKPKNIMVGAYGETLVVDWGLAKLIDDTSEATSLPSASAAPLPQSLSDSLEASRMGTVKGTIAYMSPEQANGRVDLSGPAIDIYGLAATLYHVLSGDPPGTALPSGELLRHVQKGQLPDLRQVAPWVPRPLEAICRKGMALSPADRYQSAGELARDVERWLADEPVSALPEPWSARAARWLRRHRSWAAAALASLVAITAVLGGSLLWVNEARQDEREARQEVTQLLAIARQNADGLLDAASEQLKDIPEAEEVRRRLLEQAADSYLAFLAMRTTRPELREQAGWVQIWLAEVQRELAQPEQAARSLSNAIDIFRSLGDDDHDTLATRLGLAQALHQSSEIATDQGRLADAATAIDQAMAELTGLAQDPAYSSELFRILQARGRARIQQGIVAHDHEKLSEAVRIFELALDDLQSAADLHSGEAATEQLAHERTEGKFFAAKAAVNLGHALSRTEAPSEDVERAYRAGLRDAAEIFKEDPTEARFADLLALAEQNLGAHLVEVGKTEEAAEVYRESQARYQFLVERHPRIPRYRYGLILSLVGLANAASEEDDRERSEQHLRRAVAEAKVLGELIQSLDAFHDGVVLPRWTLAKQLSESEQWQEAAAVVLEIPAELDLELGMASEEEVGPDTFSRLHYNAACYLSQMAASVEDSKASESLFERAIEELKLAASSGLGDAAWAYAAEDPHLQPLVQRHPEILKSKPQDAPEATR